MFCPNCGQELREGARFCGSCGNRIDANDQNQRAEQEDNHCEQNTAEKEKAADSIPAQGIESDQANAKQRKGIKKQTKIAIAAVACAIIAIVAVFAVTQFSREMAINTIDPSNVPANETDNGFEVDSSTPILPVEDGLPQSITQISKVMASDPSQLPSFIDSQNGSATTNSSERTDISILSYKIEPNSAIRAQIDPNSVFLDTKNDQIGVDLIGVTASELSKDVQPGIIEVNFSSKWFTDETMNYFIKVNNLSYASAKAESDDELSQSYCGCFTIDKDTYYWVLMQHRFSKTAKASEIYTALSCYKASWAVGTLPNLADGDYYDADDGMKKNSGHYISSKLANATCDHGHKYTIKKQS